MFVYVSILIGIFSDLCVYMLRFSFSLWLFFRTLSKDNKNRREKLMQMSFPLTAERQGASGFKNSFKREKEKEHTEKDRITVFFYP